MHGALEFEHQDHCPHNLLQSRVEMAAVTTGPTYNLERGGDKVKGFPGTRGITLDKALWSAQSEAVLEGLARG